MNSAVLLLLAIIIFQAEAFIQGVWDRKDHMRACNGGDDTNFRDALGWKCSSWLNYDCFKHHKYTREQLTDVRHHCPVSCRYSNEWFMKTFKKSRSVSLCEWWNQYKKSMRDYEMLAGSGRCMTANGRAPFGEQNNVASPFFCAFTCVEAEHCSGWSYDNHRKVCEYSCNKREQPCTKGGSSDFDKYNSCPTTTEEIPNSLSSKCFVKKSCKNNAVAHSIAYHLAPPGAVQCDYGQSLSKPFCESVAKSLTYHIPDRTLQIGSGGSCRDGGWGQVPSGCSVQSGGDYTAHYKSYEPMKEGCADEAYQMVCVDKTTSTIRFADSYSKIEKACVNGKNIRKYTEKTVDECAKICDETPNCKAFEFGVIHGGSGHYKPGDCQPQSSANYANCNGHYHNLDLYVPQRAFDATAGKNCKGTGTDLLRDFVGTAGECKAKCAELNCQGFVRVSSTSKCYFRNAPVTLAGYDFSDGTCFLKSPEQNGRRALEGKITQPEIHRAESGRKQ